MAHYQGVIGIVLILLLAWLVSEAKGRFPWRAVPVALLLQLLFAWVFLSVPWAKTALVWLNDAVAALQAATGAGTALVFGYLGGGSLPFQESYPGAAFILAFQALPLILVVSALSALLWYWRVLPLIVAGFAWVFVRAFKLGGGAGLASAANIFVGMVEAPLLIRPLLAQFSRADLFLLMTTGMATVAGTVLVLYATILQGVVPDPVGHIVTASVISVPAAILISRIMVPEEGKALEAAETLDKLPASEAKGAMDAITRGALDGLNLLLSVVVLLIVLVALVALIDAILGLLPSVQGAPISLERLFGLLFQPYAWALGIPWDESATAGSLIGKKTILNELLAYLDLARLPSEALSERSRVILLYALCGFANPASLGIMMGGLTALVPERRVDIVALAPRSIISGTLSTGMTAAIIGLL